MPTINSYYKYKNKRGCHLYVYSTNSKIKINHQYLETGLTLRLFNIDEEPFGRVMIYSHSSNNLCIETIAVNNLDIVSSFIILEDMLDIMIDSLKCS